MGACRRGGLLLLAKSTGLRGSWHFDLLVCEPLTGRHQVFVGPSGPALCFVDAFLVDGSGDDSCRIGKSSFRVLAVAHEDVACVFSSGGAGGGGLHQVWAGDVGVVKSLKYNARSVGRANGSIYWGIKGRSAVVALDEATMEFSVIELPHDIWGAYNEEERASRVIGGEDGALRIVRLMSNELKVFVRRRHPASDDDDWVLEKHLGLPVTTTMIATANTKCVILASFVIRTRQTWLFSVELDTMRVEREHERNKYNGEVYPYELPWPPVLPRIMSW